MNDDRIEMKFRIFRALCEIDGHILPQKMDLTVEQRFRLYTTSFLEALIVTLIRANIIQQDEFLDLLGVVQRNLFPDPESVEEALSKGFRLPFEPPDSQKSQEVFQI